MTYKCKRCGICCMQLPNWYDLSDIERAFIRLHDRGAEELFKRVVDGKCPNLVINQKGDFLATCKIYDKRFNFCKAFICKREELNDLPEIKC